MSRQSLTVNDSRTYRERPGRGGGRGPRSQSKTPRSPHVLFKQTVQVLHNSTAYQPTPAEVAVMGAIKAAKTCTECGEEYHRFVSNHDERDDLYEGRVDGTCDDCWRDALVKMWKGGA